MSRQTCQKLLTSPTASAAHLNILQLAVDCARRKNPCLHRSFVDFRCVVLVHYDDPQETSFDLRQNPAKQSAADRTRAYCLKKSQVPHGLECCSILMEEDRISVQDKYIIYQTMRLGAAAWNCHSVSVSVPRSGGHFEFCKERPCNQYLWLHIVDVGGRNFDLFTTWRTLF